MDELYNARIDEGRRVATIGVVEYYNVFLWGCLKILPGFRLCNIGSRVLLIGRRQLCTCCTGRLSVIGKRLLYGLQRHRIT